MQSSTHFGQSPWSLSSSQIVVPNSGPREFSFSLVNASGSPLIGEIRSIGECQLIADGISSHDRRGADFTAFQEYDPDAVIGWDLSTALQHDLLSQYNVAAVAAAPKETTHGWGCEPSHWRHQALMDFKDDILQNKALASDDNGSTFEEPNLKPFGYGEEAKDQEVIINGCDISDSGLEGSSPKEGGRSATAVCRERGTKAKQGTLQAPYVDVSTSSSAQWPRRADSEHTSRRKKLTTDQKRRNHIRHEQTRRGRIRDGFKELTALVPKLQGETRSKSTMLFTTIEWLETLVERNRALEGQLKQLNYTTGNS
ncbi:hypothetical protein NLG97_g4160 [Lecanicillium saksenae]|uniref:Uncharacterized protein n=1 Tax=Lecanicillium saksenae TaxID=468837 RepID=A0ACC1QZD2_9HYPO|nr:hypothetical protein NLG97_g4160 [Lecanicillium saksenae]